MQAIRAIVSGICLAGSILNGSAVIAKEAYVPIHPTARNTKITLTGHDLTVEQLVAIARFGAQVEIGDSLRQGAADSLGLMLQAQAENVPVYLFNRRPGSEREIVSLIGDPDSASYKAAIEARYDPEKYWEYPTYFGEDIPREDVGRAMLAVDLNNMRYVAASPGFVQGIADLLNKGVTPAVYWRGTVGESDFVPTGAVLRGVGRAYYKGVEMPASEALKKAGLKPVRFEAADGYLMTSSALTAGFSALLVYDIQRLIEWHDLIWSMDMAAMNGSVGPLTMPVQSTRPFPWANFAARRVLDMLRGSYLFNDEHRIIQDPESLRATVWRSAGVWASWAALRDDTLIQMNSTDHNPTVRPGISPSDSWELSTPQMMKYYVKGGKWSHGQHGYILSNSNWDPYPLINHAEEFTISLTNLMVAVVERVHRFEDPFFTGTNADKIVAGVGRTNAPNGMGGGGGGGLIDAFWQELKPTANPIPADGVTSDKGVGDLDAVPVQKLLNLQKAVSLSQDMLGQDLLNATVWIDIRHIESPSRQFGDAPTHVWKAFRERVPFIGNTLGQTPLASRADPASSPSALASDFVRSVSAREFYVGANIAMPGGEPVIPRAEPTHLPR